MKKFISLSFIITSAFLIASPCAFADGNDNVGVQVPAQRLQNKDELIQGVNGEKKIDTVALKGDRNKITKESQSYSSQQLKLINKMLGLNLDTTFMTNFSTNLQKDPTSAIASLMTEIDTGMDELMPKLDIPNKDNKANADYNQFKAHFGMQNDDTKTKVTKLINKVNKLKEEVDSEIKAEEQANNQDAPNANAENNGQVEVNNQDAPNANAENNGQVEANNRQVEANNRQVEANNQNVQPEARENALNKKEDKKEIVANVQQQAPGANNNDIKNNNNENQVGLVIEQPPEVKKNNVVKVQGVKNKKNAPALNIKNDIAANEIKIHKVKKLVSHSKKKKPQEVIGENEVFAKIGKTPVKKKKAVPVNQKLEEVKIFELEHI